jgi:anti-sigma B factor antagonist
MSEFKIRIVEGAGGTRILKLEGPLTLQTLFEFQDLVRKLETPGLILDLSGVPYMDSAGLGAMLGAYASCQRQGRRFALADVSPRVLTLLQVAHVDTILARYESAEAAQAQLWGAESA